MVVPMQLMISNIDLIDLYQFIGFKDANSWDLTNALTYYNEKMGKKCNPHRKIVFFVPIEIKQ